MADILDQEEIDILLDICDEKYDSLSEDTLEESDTSNIILHSTFNNVSDKELKNLILKMQQFGASTTSVQIKGLV